MGGDPTVSAGGARTSAEVDQVAAAREWLRQHGVDPGDPGDPRDPGDPGA